MSIAKCRSCGQQYLPDSPDWDAGVCSDCRSLATVPPTVAPTIAKSVETFSPIPLHDYPQLPGYEILGELGRGGMGVVYKAKQSALNRIVALKVILVGAHATASERERFRTEAETVARMQHPNILHVHELGEWTVPGTTIATPYLSLEFCGGGGLDGRVRGKPMPPQVAAQLVEVLARAIQHAHERGIIHRDLKPANILFTDAGIPKVADFGMAKILGEKGTTQSGAVMGTPSYMAPEQASGRSKESGPATDVYALGALLYECLTGRPPYRGETALDTLLSVVNDPLPTLPASIPEPLHAICQRCMRKKAAERYSSAQTLADDLRRWLSGQRIEGASPLPMSRGVKDWFIGVVLTSLVVLALVAGAVAWLKLAPSKRQQGEDKTFRPAYRLPDREGVVLEWKAAGPVHSLAVSPDGRHLATGGNGSIRLWDLETRAAILEWKTPESKESEKIHSLEFNADGTRLLSLGDDGRPRIWDAESGKLLASPRPYTTVKRAGWLGTDGSVLSGTGYGLVEFFEAGEGELPCKTSNTIGVNVLSEMASRPGSMQFAIVGHPLGESPQLWLGELAAEKKGRTFAPGDLGKGERFHPICSAFSADGKLLVSGEESGKVRLWQPDSGKLLFTFDGWGKPIQRVVCSPKDNRALVADSIGAIHLIGIGEHHTEALVLSRNNKVVGLAFSFNGRHVLLSDGDGTVRVVGLPKK